MVRLNNFCRENCQVNMGKQQKHNLIFFQVKSKTNCLRAANKCEPGGREPDLAALPALVMSWLPGHPAGNKHPACTTRGPSCCTRFLSSCTILGLSQLFFSTGISRAVEQSMILGLTVGLFNDESLIFGCSSAHKTRLSTR